MLFNSIEFLLFLPTVFVLYWFVFNGNLKLQNLFLLLVSYVFYGWWDWRFLFLIILSSIVDYSIGMRMKAVDNHKSRKGLLLLSLLVNLGILGYFKYYNFFLENFIAAFGSLGVQMNISSLQIILPVGISFYTFQTLSYTIDVYRRQIEPTEDLIQFFAYVSFFPQLVAGPIERAKNLLPQFKNKRNFSYAQATDGLRQILWGFFKKIVIADNCATIVNDIFANYADYSGPTLIIGAVLFAFQIYGDFSGYSDIAIGTARLFGFNLMQNFAYPYFSRDIAEFWRRWHISLSTWFRDYLYVPLGGSRIGTSGVIRNIFIIFLVSGFWHGANWTFIVWGGLNALYFLPLLLLNKNRRHLEVVANSNILPSIKEFMQIAITFGLTTLAWIFFRAENISHAISYLNQMVHNLNYLDKSLLPGNLVLVIGLLIFVEWFGRRNSYALYSLKNMKIIYRWSVYLILLFSIYLFGNFQSDYEFIYFQF